jgi:tRNA (guanine-N7-)-methyltransferase
MLLPASLKRLAGGMERRWAQSQPAGGLHSVMKRSLVALTGFAVQHPMRMVGSGPSLGKEASLSPAVLQPVAQPEVIPTTAASARARNDALRVRQHVNPLATYFQRPIALPEDWYTAHFASTAAPLTIDVGVARGRWVRTMAVKHPDMNYLGLEIRAGLVAGANALRDRDQLRNLHYLYANANVSFANIVRGVPDGSVLHLVCFQFSDPWFKTRHAKRRMVQEPLVRQVADALRAGSGRCYMATDVGTLAVEMRDLFDQSQDFERDAGLAWTSDGWLRDNPFGVPTEREIAVTSDPDSQVYRAMFRVREREA